MRAELLLSGPRDSVLIFETQKRQPPALEFSTLGILSLWDREAKEERQILMTDTYRRKSVRTAERKVLC